MKKLIYGSLFFALVGIGMVGCKKENVRQNEVQNVSNEFGVSTDGKMLIFETLEDYEKAVVIREDESKKGDLLQIVKSFKFKNYFSNVQQKSENPEHEMDDFIGQLLSPEGTIQIENHIYKIDLPNEKVYVIEAANKEKHYNDLITGNISNKEVKEYSTGDDVLYAVKDGETEKCGGIGGGIYRCYANTYQGQIVKTFSDGVVWRLNPFARFFRMGIYFRLSSQFEVWRYPSSSHTTGGQVVSNISGSGVTIEMFVRSPAGWWQRRPCNSGTIGILNPGFHYSQNIYGNYTKVVYDGIRNLNGYYFFVQGRAKYTDGSVTIASPYGGRNINSPY